LHINGLRLHRTLKSEQSTFTGPPQATSHWNFWHAMYVFLRKWDSKISIKWSVEGRVEGKRAVPIAENYLGSKFPYKLQCGRRGPLQWSDFKRKNSSHEISVSDSAGSYCRIIWRLIAPGQFLCSFYDVHVNNSQLMI
jgi:hypothetical protein